MMTSRQRNSYIRKYFLSHIKVFGYHQEGSYLISTPIQDLIKGFCFDWLGDRAYVHWFLMPVFVQTDFIFLSFGNRLKAKPPIWDRFNMDNANISENTKLISELIMNKLHDLNKINTIQDFLDVFYKEESKNKDIRWLEVKAYSYCFLGKENYNLVIDDFLDSWEDDDRNNLDWMQEIRYNILQLRSASQVSKEESIALLSSWRLETLKKLKLDKYTVEALRI